MAGLSCGRDDRWALGMMGVIHEGHKGMRRVIGVAVRMTLAGVLLFP